MLLIIRSHRRSIIWISLLAVVLILAAMPFLAATPGELATAASDCSLSTRVGFGTPAIQCSQPPDVPYIARAANSPTQASVYEDWAWKSFIALNWPALATRRGIPDLTQSFAQAANGTQGVWETWKEKRELFITTRAPGDWNEAVEYPDNKVIAACPGEETAVKVLGSGARLFAQVGKAALGLDEALQVPSESGPGTTLSGKAVTPQVWHGVHTASGENAVVYEVKFNYDYYNYVKSQRLYLDTVKNDRRLNSGSSVIVSLAQPCRDSMGNPIPFPQNINSHANQGPCAVSFPPRYPPTGAVVPPIEIVPPPVPPPANVLPSAVYDVGTCATFNGKYPCPTGAIQTKAAWRRITEAEKSDFHWTPGLYYRVTNGSAHPPQVCIAAGNFGLIGLHIIQKTTNQGHYIFATWEHKSVSTDLYTFAEKPAPSNTRTKSAGAIAPAFPGGIRVKRDHDILKSTQLTNEQYYKLISLINPHSVWLNYQLVGVQYIPVQCWGKDDKPCASDGFDVGREDPTGNGQPFHLANLVIETNWGLQNFQGRPPTVNSGPPVTGFSTSPSGVSVDDHYLPNKSMGFDRSLGNVGHSRKNRGLVFNMGGCMGCHGVAQGLGTDFSFALLLGQKGSHPEGPNQEQDLDPKTVRFGQDLSIQYRTLVSPPVSLGIGAGNTIVAAGAPAEQQWVLINPTESGPLSQVTDLSTVVLQSTTAGNYLLATSEVAHKEPGTTWYRLQLAPAFTGDVAKWSVRKLHGKPGALQKNDSFCLVNKQPVDGKSVYLSRYAFDDVGAATVDRCEEKNSWKFGEPFAPLR